MAGGGCDGGGQEVDLADGDGRRARGAAAGVRSLPPASAPRSVVGLHGGRRRGTELVDPEGKLHKVANCCGSLARRSHGGRRRGTELVDPEEAPHGGELLRFWAR